MGYRKAEEILPIEIIELTAVCGWREYIHPQEGG